MEPKTDLRQLTDLWREIAMRTALGRKDHDDFIKAVASCLDTMVPAFERMVSEPSFNAEKWELAVTGLGFAKQMFQETHDPTTLAFVQAQLESTVSGQIARRQALALQSQ